MPTAATPVLQIPYVANAKPLDSIEGALLARLVALNSTDPQIAALLAQWQALMGKPFGQ